MVDIERDEAHGRCRFVLSPNQSISWSGLKLFFLAQCLAASSVAVPLSLLGYWPILPFAGLELLAVGAGLYVTARRGQMREVIDIDPDSVRIERGLYRPEQHWRVTRLWARVVLERCPKRWYPSRLLIRSHGRSVEVGRFLNEDERQHLATELSRDLNQGGAMERC